MSPPGLGYTLAVIGCGAAVAAVGWALRRVRRWRRRIARTRQ